MRITAIILTLLLLACCYPINPDGTINMPTKNIEDLEGHWVGLNENYLAGLSLVINKNGTGTIFTTLLNEISDPINIRISIDKNIVKVSAANEEISDLTFTLEPTLMIMSIDQELDNAHLKLSLIKEEVLLKKLKELKVKY